MLNLPAETMRTGPGCRLGPAASSVQRAPHAVRSILRQVGVDHGGSHPALRGQVVEEGNELALQPNTPRESDRPRAWQPNTPQAKGTGGVGKRESEEI